MAVGTLATKEIGCVVALYFPPKADSPAPLSPAGPVGPVGPVAPTAPGKP